jgi:hypothetical protein
LRTFERFEHGNILLASPPVLGFENENRAKAPQTRRVYLHKPVIEHSDLAAKL